MGIDRLLSLEVSSVKLVYQPVLSADKACCQWDAGVLGTQGSDPLLPLLNLALGKQLDLYDWFD